MEEDRSGSRGTDQSVVFKKKKKRNKYYLSESNFSQSITVYNGGNKGDEDEDSWLQLHSQLVSELFNFSDNGKIDQKETSHTFEGAGE